MKACQMEKDFDLSLPTPKSFQMNNVLRIVVLMGFVSTFSEV